MREARPITTQNPSVGLYRFATAFPGHREHVALQRQPFASALPCGLTPFGGCQNLREARSIRTQNPAVSLCRFATAFPSHREHVALQRQPFASALALPRGNNPFPSLQVHSIASALPSHRPVSIQKLRWVPYLATHLSRSQGRPDGALCLTWIRPVACADHTTVPHSGHLCACCCVRLLTTPFCT